MQQNRDIQHVYLVGAKSLGAYGGYETFIYNALVTALCPTWLFAFVTNV